jgi:hypothetical protein
MASRAGARTVEHRTSPPPMTVLPTCPRVLFIAGLGRSGTTLVERLLGQIDGVQTLGETVHLWVRGIQRDETCGCGLAFHECPFWKQIGDAAFGGWSQVDVNAVLAMHNHVDRLRRVPGVVTHPGPEVRRYAGMFRSIYEAAQKASRAKLIVDSSKHPSMAYCLRTQSNNLDLRVVHVVRDPRAVAYSWAKTVARPEAGVEDMFMSQYAPARAAALWDAENVAVTGLGRLGVPVMRLHYEDLVADPSAEVRRLLDFAGMPAGVPIPIEGHRATLRPNHTVSGNPLRFHNGELDIRRDDGWLTGLGSRDRRVVSAMTAPLRLAYGRHGSAINP